MNPLDMISSLGFPIVMSLLLWRAIVKNNKIQEKAIIEIRNIVELIYSGIEKLSCNVGKTVLSKEQSLNFFKIIMQNHIFQKLKFVEGILDRNDIKYRETQLKSNLYVRFREITQEEITILSSFNTPAGNLGEILEKNIDWVLFMDQCFEIIFTDQGKEAKLNDLRSLMNGYVVKFLEIIEVKIENGRG